MVYTVYPRYTCIVDCSTHFILHSYRECFRYSVSSFQSSKLHTSTYSLYIAMHATMVGCRQTCLCMPRCFFKVNGLVYGSVFVQTCSGQGVIHNSFRVQYLLRYHLETKVIPPHFSTNSAKIDNENSKKVKDKYFNKLNYHFH